MKFRTEIEDLRSPFEITQDAAHGIVMLGSCFTDNIGALLERDGFNVCHNPFGPLYNPASLSTLLSRLIRDNAPYTATDLVRDASGTWHCLDFASRYQSADLELLLAKINDDLVMLRDKLMSARHIIVTFGTAWVFSRQGRIAGNCHKLPATEFERKMMNTASIAQLWRPLTDSLLVMPGKPDIIFTVSPVRHTADGLAGNSLSKATLRVAVDSIVSHSDRARCMYFPAYEIVYDDLRDYRFYAADLKHPSDIAIEYIYEKFGNTFFSKTTVDKAIAARRTAALAAHRPILPQPTETRQP